jgi:hypothetical protein
VSVTQAHFLGNGARSSNSNLALDGSLRGILFSHALFIDVIQKCTDAAAAAAAAAYSCAAVESRTCCYRMHIFCDAFISVFQSCVVSKFRF